MKRNYWLKRIVLENFVEGGKKNSLFIGKLYVFNVIDKLIFLLEFFVDILDF